MRAVEFLASGRWLVIGAGVAALAGCAAPSAPVAVVSAVPPEATVVSVRDAVVAGPSAGAATQILAALGEQPAPVPEGTQEIVVRLANQQVKDMTALSPGAGVFQAGQRVAIGGGAVGQITPN